MEKFEQSWAKGKEFLLDDSRLKSLNIFSSYLESLMVTNKDFNEQVEC